MNHPVHAPITPSRFMDLNVVKTKNGTKQTMESLLAEEFVRVQVALVEAVVGDQAAVEDLPEVEAVRRITTRITIPQQLLHLRLNVTTV